MSPTNGRRDPFACLREKVGMRGIRSLARSRFGAASKPKKFRSAHGPSTADMPPRPSCTGVVHGKPQRREGSTRICRKRIKLYVSGSWIETDRKEIQQEDLAVGHQKLSYRRNSSVPSVKKISVRTSRFNLFSHRFIRGKKLMAEVPMS